jgi:hypothetical protein
MSGSVLKESLFLCVSLDHHNHVSMFANETCATEAMGEGVHKIISILVPIYRTRTSPSSVELSALRPLLAQLPSR